MVRYDCALLCLLFMTTATAGSNYQCNKLIYALILYKRWIGRMYVVKGIVCSHYAVLSCQLSSQATAISLDTEIM